MPKIELIQDVNANGDVKYLIEVDGKCVNVKFTFREATKAYEGVKYNIVNGISRKKIIRTENV